MQTQITQLIPEPGVQVRERLIEKEYPRPGRSRACQRDTLLFTARQKMGVFRAIPRHSDLVENLMHAGIPFFCCQILEAECHVFGNGEVREKCKILKQQADLPFFRRNIKPGIGKYTDRSS